MDKEKLLDYAVRLIEANLRGKAVTPLEFDKMVRDQIPATYKTLANFWETVSEENKA